MSKIAGKLVNGLKTLAKKVTTKSVPQKDVKKFVTSMPTIKEVCGKEASKAVANQAKASISIIDKQGIEKLLGTPKAQSAVQQYNNIKSWYEFYGSQMPTILNNKMTVAERIEYLKECLAARQQRRDDLAKAFLGVSGLGKFFVR